MIPTAGPGAPAAPAGRNEQYPWDQFAPAQYCDHNYARMRADDARILRRTVSWFAAATTATGPAAGPREGLDVGAGPNLYPALAMLPFCDSITLREYSSANVRWLGGETAALSARWQPFWQVVSPDGAYGGFDEARELLARRARVVQGSVFDLPRARWDLGTMFFVAESISADPAEFGAAVHGFVRALRPGAPFAAAFMEHSTGYHVADVEYPATPVGAREITERLEPGAVELAVTRIEMDPAPLRPGYTGMVLATGRARQP